MCVPHIFTARTIAGTESNTQPTAQHPLTPPIINELNPLGFAIVALGSCQFAMEQNKYGFGNYFDPREIDGFDPAGLTTKESKTLYSSSSLSLISDDQILKDRKTLIPFLKSSMQNTLQLMNDDDIKTLEDLGFTGEKITVDGVSEMTNGIVSAPNIRSLGTFLSDAGLSLNMTSEGKLAVNSDFTDDTIFLSRDTDQPKFEKLLKYTHHFLDQDGVTDALQTVWEGFFAGMFRVAEHQLELGAKNVPEKKRCPKCVRKDELRASGAFDKASDAGTYTEPQELLPPGS